MHRLLAEQWDRQCYRLAKYLERNWCLLNDIPVNMEVEDEKFERPESVGSLGRVLEQVKRATTPRTEKEEYFDRSQDTPPPLPTTANANLTADEKHQMSFKQFVVERGVETPERVQEVEVRTKALRVEPGLDAFEEPKTPTQAVFTP